MAMREIRFLLLAFYATVAVGCGQSVWRYEDRTVLKGTRSEGKIGILQVAEVNVYPFSVEIVTSDGVFEYLYNYLPFAKSGYRGWQLRKSRQWEPPVSGKMTRSDLERGWYSSAEGTRKNGMPNSWAWLPFRKIWVSPEHINDPSVYSSDGWEYRIEVMNAETWNLKGLLLKDGKEVSPHEQPLQTPLGTFRWGEYTRTEWGWLYDKHLPTENTP